MLIKIEIGPKQNVISTILNTKKEPKMNLCNYRKIITGLIVIYIIWEV